MSNIEDGTYIPIIFAHRGSGENYLECVLRQAKNLNPIVCLLGDEQNKKFDQIVAHDYIKNYSNISNEFAKIYIPLSTLGDYELFCFQRWFVLYEYMKAQKFDRCLYLDSDMMFYSDAYQEVTNKFDYFNIMLVHKCVGSSCYITYEGLKDFCKFLYETFANPKSWDFVKIASHWECHKMFGRTGGVCDMTFFEYYGRYKDPAGVGELMHVTKEDDSTYDHCINQNDRYYEMENGIKKIQFNNGFPYCKHLKLNKMIKFNTLHFQGGCKGLIPQFLMV